MNRPFKPEDGALNGPQHCWRIAQRMFATGPFTIAQLHGLTNGVERRTVKEIVLDWVKQGQAEVVERKTGREKSGQFFASTYRIVAAAQHAPVRRRASYTGDRGRRQQQLWTAMRTLPQFGIPELAYAASTEDLYVDVGIARSYVGRLVKAGLLLSLLPYSKGRKGAFGGGAQAGLYRLKPSANTGPKAVRILKDGSVFDPNVASSTPVRRIAA